MNVFARLFICLGLGCLAAAPMHADTYTAYNLSYANDRNLVGIDQSGDVLLFSIPTNQYERYSGGALVSTSSSRPDFITDNGMACTGPTGGLALCNGDREVYSDAATRNIFEISPGSDPLGDLIAVGPLDIGSGTGSYVSSALNSRGDFVFIDGFQEEVREVAVTSTPEPSSLLLLTTGLGSAAALVRRGRSRQGTATL